MASLLELKTIDDAGNPPESRLTDAVDVVNLVNRLINADEKRAFVRARVKGLFDGNPPYRDGDLRNAGQSYRTNVNWRIAESFLTVALTAYWDVISEGPSMATCVTSEGDPNQQNEWSAIITEEFDKFNKADPELNYMFETSHYYMTLFGVGPVIWEDELDYCARPVSNVLVPDGEVSNINDWSVAIVIVDYSVDKLYSFIRKESAATDRGWNIKAVREAMVNSVNQSTFPESIGNRWEWLQQRLRNNDLSVSVACDKISVAHVFYKEFPIGNEREGKISHCIVQTGKNNNDYLYRKLRRFENWRQLICPFYYDVGDGTHHSVKGLGIKAFGALESYNRLQCSVVDSAAFGASMHIQTMNENMRQNAAVIEMGPYKVWPSGFTIIPNVNLGQMLDGPMMVKQDLISTVTSNVAQYRQGLSEKGGNPITAAEVQWRAENESTLSRTQLTRYFDQCDEFWAERYRRVANPSAISEEAKEFQSRCKKRGVTAAALTNMESVRATRTVGYGSAYNRLQSLNRMMALIQLLPEDGQRNLVKDLASAQVGPTLTNRYLPDKPDEFTNDRVIASLQVAAAKQGITPVLPEDVNNEVFADTFLAAAGQAIQSLEQGADPQEIYVFLNTIGPAIAEHINVIASKPHKKPIANLLEQQLKKISQVTDQLRKQLEQQAQQQAKDQQTMMQAKAVGQGMDPETQLKAAETRAKLQMTAEKTKQMMDLKAAKAQQDMAIADVKTAQEIRNTAAKNAQKSKE